MKLKQIVPLLIAILFLLPGFKLKNDSNESNRAAGNQLSVYEVNFTHTGHLLLYGTLKDCPINPSGKVVLKGKLSGVENVIRKDDPILYTGVLDLNINIDICSAMRGPNGEDKFCGMTVKGEGLVYTELELDPAGRRAYIKIASDSLKNGKFTKSIGGTCDQQQMAEERHMVPNETIATIFNGRDLPMLVGQKTLKVGSYVENDGGNKTEVNVIRKIQ